MRVDRVQAFVEEIRASPKFVAAAAKDVKWIAHLNAIERGLEAFSQAGYKEQADSYTMMASTARMTAAGEEDIANKTENAGTLTEFGDFAGALMKGAAAAATIPVPV